MKRFILYVLLLSFLPIHGISQTKLSGKAKRQAKRAARWDSIPPKKGLRFYIGLDSRHSYLSDKAGKIFGLKIGMIYNYKFRFGIGFYNMVNSVVLNPSVPFQDTLMNVFGKDSIVTDTGKKVSNFNYTTLFFEPILIHRTRWEISLPLMIGIGNESNSVLDDNGKTISKESHYPMVAEVDVTGYYKLYRWIGLGAGTGYIFTMSKSNDITRKYSSPLYIFKVKIFISYLYRLVFPKKKD